MKFNCQQLNHVRPSPGSIVMCIATCVCVYCCVIVLSLKCSFIQDGWTPLFTTCQKGHLPVVERLIAAKADVNHQKTVSYHCSLDYHGNQEECIHHHVGLWSMKPLWGELQILVFIAFTSECV